MSITLLEAVAHSTPFVPLDVPGAVQISEQIGGVTVEKFSKPVEARVDALSEFLNAGWPNTGEATFISMKRSVFDGGCLQSDWERWHLN